MLRFQNVDEAFGTLVSLFHTKDIPLVKKDSRNGPVLMCPEPVTICFENPRNRVLFNESRDANPFFHLYESLWMLAGRNDVAPLKYYASTIDQFSDDGKTFNGAYGYRWRKQDISKFWGDDRIRVTKPVDQLDLLIKHLQQKPESRRAVLQMWNVEDDLLKIDSSKDVCCNLSVCFSVRYTDEREGQVAEQGESPRYLDMTVTNRSNDMIWGLLGANVVHFSYLLEYMAEQIGVEVGKQYHFTNNLHVYTDTNSGWTPEAWLENNLWLERSWEYPETQPMGELTDKDLGDFICYNDYRDPSLKHNRSKYLRETVQPALDAFRYHKKRQYKEALESCDNISSRDWRIACKAWITKRYENWKKKTWITSPQTPDEKES